MEQDTREITGFHAHVYYDAETRPTGARIRECLGAKFSVSKGPQQAVSSTTDWPDYEIPFYLRKNQRPDLIKLNIAVEGTGTVWLRNVELLKTPLSS